MLLRMIKFLSKFKYKHIQSLIIPISWDIVPKENITFILLENGFGWRKYAVHTDGYSKSYQVWKAYKSIGEAWKHGAALATCEGIFNKLVNND